MRLFLAALLFVMGLFYLFVGAGFLVNPAAAGNDLGLVGNGARGLSSLRADMTAFFYVGGGAMIWGAWRRRGDMLLVSATLFGIAFFGRLISLFTDGAYPDWTGPALVELVTAIVCLIGWWVLPVRIPASEAVREAEI